jgi:hypothetical protein
MKTYAEAQKANLNDYEKQEWSRSLGRNLGLHLDVLN